MQPKLMDFTQTLWSAHIIDVGTAKFSAAMAYGLILSRIRRQDAMQANSQSLGKIGIVRTPREGLA